MVAFLGDAKNGRPVQPEVPYGCKLWSSPSRSSPNPGGIVCQDFARKISTHLLGDVDFWQGFCSA